MIRFNISPRSVFSTLLSLSVTLFSYSQKNDKSSDRISLLFIGDIMGHDEQIRSAKNRETHTYNYDDVFRYIKPLISDADIAIANFEVTLAGPPFMGYPRFSSPPALASACQKAGIEYLVTANNHSADKGITGITGTIMRLDSIGIQHTGTFTSSQARDSLYPLMIKRSGVSIALLNYTFSTNGIIVPEPVIVNMLDKKQITIDVRKAKTDKADVIILFLHWGTEYDTIPAKSQTDLAEYFFSIGVDMVIGSHPHVLQKMVWLKNGDEQKDRIVIYSLGNFVTNQNKPKTDGGSMVRVEIVRRGDKCIVSEAGYYLTWVYTPIEKYRKKYFILPCSEFENNPGFFSNPSDYNQMKYFIDNSRNLLNKQNINMPEYIYNGTSWLLNN